MESILRGAAVYLVMLLIVRLSGRRTVAEMTVFDLVLLLIVAEATQQALLGEDFSIINLVVLAVTLFSMDIGFSFIMSRWPKLGVMIDGQPSLIVANGKLDRHVMRRARVSRAEVLAAARREGLERLDQVKHAVLEVDGKLSIIPKE